MWQVILFLAVTVGAYFILRSVGAAATVTPEADVPQEETAKEWAARVHGLTFDDDRRQRSGLPTLSEKIALQRPNVERRRRSSRLDEANVRLARHGIRIETDADMTDAELEDYHRRIGQNDYRAAPVEIDHWKSTLTIATFEGVEGSDLVIRYKGSREDRQITVLRVMEGQHALYLESLCRLRNAPRMFRVDQIDQIVSAEGEVFESGEAWVRTLTRIP